MSKAMVDGFMAVLAENPELLARIKNAGSREKMAAVAETLGHERGFDFTASDFARAAETETNGSSGELDESQLDAVAGGHATKPPKQMPVVQRVIGQIWAAVEDGLGGGGNNDSGSNNDSGGKGTTGATATAGVRG